VHPGEFPKLAGDLEGVDAGSLPPGLLVTGAVHRAVMGAAKRNGEFITRLATECPRLHESQVMRIGRLAGTQEARLVRTKQLEKAPLQRQRDIARSFETEERISTLLEARSDAISDIARQQPSSVIGLASVGIDLDAPSPGRSVCDVEGRHAEQSENN
jgi:hypothetical protein